MKRDFIIAFVVFFLGTATILQATAIQCERLEEFGAVYDVSRVADDLVSGSWDVRVSGAYGTMYFREDGSADHINTYLDGKQIATCAWSVTIERGEVIANLTYPDGKSEKFALTPTCDGYAVRNIYGKNGTMWKITEQDERMLEQSRLQITGHWESAGSSKRDRQSAMVWEFDRNGKFRMAMAPDYTHSIMEGIWDLTPDGNNVMLFFTATGAPEAVYAREILKIHGLDFEDLVLAGDTFERLISKTSSASAMHFEKIPGI